MIHLKLFILCGALLLQLQNYTKNWEGSDLPGHSFAKFERFNGKQGFKIKLDNHENFTFNYKTTLKKGSLLLEIKSSNKTVFSKNLHESDSGELKILNPRGKKYKFVFKAKEADGSFDITYKKVD